MAQVRGQEGRGEAERLRSAQIEAAQTFARRGQLLREAAEAETPLRQIALATPRVHSARAAGEVRTKHEALRLKRLELAQIWQGHGRQLSARSADASARRSEESQASARRRAKGRGEFIAALRQSTREGREQQESARRALHDAVQGRSTHDLEAKELAMSQRCELARHTKERVSEWAEERRINSMLFLADALSTRAKLIMTHDETAREQQARRNESAARQREEERRMREEIALAKEEQQRLRRAAVLAVQAAKACDPPLRPVSAPVPTPTVSAPVSAPVSSAPVPTSGTRDHPATPSAAAPPQSERRQGTSNPRASPSPKAAAGTDDDASAGAWPMSWASQLYFGFRKRGAGPRSAGGEHRGGRRATVVVAV